MKEKSYDELDFTDDFLFCKIMMENEDLCIEMAEMITGRQIRMLVCTEDQKTIRLTRNGKGVRFDVYFEDDEKVIYDIEMQATKKKDLPKRTRYYQGMIDLNVLTKGDKYTLLRESYIIFICTFDEFEKGRHKYSFENACLEDPEVKLKDGTHKIFLCAAGTMDDCSDKMKDFLDYIAGGTKSGALSDRLRAEVEKSKSNEKWRLDYMTLEEKYREKFEEGKEEGRAEGRADLLLSQVCRKLRKGKSVPQIADELEEDEIRIQAIYHAVEEFAPDYDEEKVFDAVQAIFE